MCFSTNTSPHFFLVGIWTFLEIKSSHPRECVNWCNLEECHMNLQTPHQCFSRIVYSSWPFRLLYWPSTYRSPWNACLDRTQKMILSICEIPVNAFQQKIGLFSGDNVGLILDFFQHLSLQVSRKCVNWGAEGKVPSVNKFPRNL